MAKVCDVCGKGYLKGNLVSFSNKKSIKRSYPNLRKVRISVDGRSVRVKICASCLSAKRLTEASQVKSQSQIV
ncbi:50S ribosomal protein L28 [candidate division WWE3 bacterium RIFCSPHIGHO2_01_FULL_40_23]|uniref:Large ribosomal subunit protein bL28 n=1 Tax=candidate division WWE3 bacterium RIFCSPLOWO2_01_FULL_41_18 TaxID=1802625 RepID=A0A1F4VEY1_UNCKA|nr:MAG: 50S ribosomal protein L28 [candidate division WWE3 bacterium RIFCSPHIGHO2_01_FULL_40_23]OGC55518.1 MAG: 50S ribosomal protein L28 [candidate division WWE3 bacterium RIFCSPLOWO2_01_FULL_41_18]